MRSRRVLDVVLVLVAAPVVVLVGGALAVAVLIDSGRPVLFRGRRVGRNGVPFDVLKFRSMRNDTNGSKVTTADDDRITRVGRHLRNWKLDEIPQLLNVLRGEMSLVGPRPEDLAYTARYTEEQWAILQYRPGITSPASLRFRNEETLLAEVENIEEFYCNTLLPAKIATDLEYFAHSGARSDVGLILRTLRAVVVSTPVDNSLIMAAHPAAAGTAAAPMAADSAA